MQWLTHETSKKEQNERFVEATCLTVCGREETTSKFVAISENI